jgi:hypothetical protein
VRTLGDVSKTFAVKVFDKQSLKKKKNWKKVNGKMVMTTALQVGLLLYLCGVCLVSS